MLEQFQRDFIEYCFQRQALRFGQFTLKSGRQSPYFFNAGLFNTAHDIKKLGEFYAAAIMQADIDYDVLFGPAYKGIPLAVSTVIALTQHGKDIPYAFNRKEVKDHGEGGRIVGANLQDKKILLIDDTVTAGTAVRESVQILKEAQAKLVGVMIALDRQERGQGLLSATQEIYENYHIPVFSIVTLADLINYLDPNKYENELQAMNEYRQQYGIEK